MILITTSRRPTRRLRTLCHDLAHSIPNAIRVNRGKLNLEGIAERTLEFNADRVIIVSRWRGGPGKVEFFQCGSEGLTPVPPVLYVAGVRLLREFEVRSRPIRSLVVATEPDGPPEIMKVAESLSNFFGVPLSNEKRVASKYQASMQISTAASGFNQITFVLLPEAVEVGPRFTLSHLAWEIRK